MSTLSEMIERHGVDVLDYLDRSATVPVSAGLQLMRQLRGDERCQVRRNLAASYRAGASIRQLAVETSRSYWQVRTLLVEAGVQLRPRGGPRKDGW